MAYNEDEYLMLSGIQHFCFCRRQWALIHIEQIWHENLLTTEGRIVHEHVHDPSLDEKRGDLLIIRGMNVFSSALGVSGQCDIVEFHKDEDRGVPIRGRDGLWAPMPVEYKRGKPKSSDADRFQLCCQAMCLEEMLQCSIKAGCLFYNEPRKRETVVFDMEMRRSVTAMLEDMHRLFQKGTLPGVKVSPACRSCSLADDCLPSVGKFSSVSGYIDARLREQLNA